MTFMNVSNLARKQRLILWIDKVIGVPLCAVLSSFAWLGRHRRGHLDYVPSRILFVKLVEMGSNVLASSAFDEAARLVGAENIYIMTLSENRPILELLPYFPATNIITVGGGSLQSLGCSMLRALQQIRKLRIDAAVDFDGLTRTSAIITYLTGARLRVGYYNFTCEGPYRGRLFNREVNYTFQHHASITFKTLIRTLANRTDQPLLKEQVSVAPPPRFIPLAEDLSRVRKLLEGLLHGERRDLVVLNPNCSDIVPLRRWPSERYIDLGRALLAQDGVSVVVTGSPGERTEGARIAAAIGQAGRCISLAGRTTLRDLLTLYCGAKLLISNDSGPCHFASMTPVDVIALFGPETPQLYGPMGDRVTIIYKRLACSPCVNLLNHRVSPCKDNACMKEISVEEVLQAAKGVLDRRQGTVSEVVFEPRTQNLLAAR